MGSDLHILGESHGKLGELCDPLSDLVHYRIQPCERERVRESVCVRERESERESRMGESRPRGGRWRSLLCYLRQGDKTHVLSLA